MDVIKAVRSHTTHLGEIKWLFTYNSQHTIRLDKVLRTYVILRTRVHFSSRHHVKDVTVVSWPSP